MNPALIEAYEKKLKMAWHFWLANWYVANKEDVDKLSPLQYSGLLNSMFSAFRAGFEFRASEGE